MISILNPRIRVILVAVVGLLLVACSKQGTGTLGETGDESEIDRTITLSADEFQFSQENIAVAKDETIAFVVSNDGSASHEFAIGEPHEHDAAMEHDPSSGGTGAITPGAETTLIWHFTKSGETNFACYIAGHNEQGMTGTITVSE